MTRRTAVGGTDARRTVDLGEVRLHVHESGRGRPLLLMTGIGANLEMWDPLVRELHRSGIRTITFDAPGTGRSSTLQRPLRMAGLARLVARLLDALGHERVDVLGVSFGGALAQQFAHQFPSRVDRLVLAATAAGVPGLGGVPGSPRSLLGMMTRRRYRDPAFRSTRARSLYGGDPLTPGALAAAVAHPPTGRGYLHQLWAIQAWTSLPWLWTVRRPTLVLSGDDDRILPPVNGRILARVLPDARLEIVPGGGHLFLLQRAPEMARTIAAFLDG